jgi:dihydrofolate reductase
MRKIITTTFVTLDGVMQAPGGPGEDTSGGFKHGGWTVHYWDELMGNIMNGFLSQPFELLLGRRTYDIFASFWPHTDKDQEVAVPFNAAKKHVVSHSPHELTWENSELITGDVVDAIKKLKEESGPDLWVHGSGKRLFAEGAQPQAFKLTDSKIATTGVVIATYEPAGALVTGSFA